MINRDARTVYTEAYRARRMLETVLKQGADRIEAHFAFNDCIVPLYCRNTDAAYKGAVTTWKNLNAQFVN